MRRWIAIAWHATFLILAAGLYFFFVLPRWFELTGAWPLGLGKSLRIVDGVLVGLAALPIVFTLLHTRKPEFGTPQLALTLRFWSIVLHVLAGVLIVGAAVAELWVSLDTAGQWLFAIYGGAAAIAVLGALAFYLAYLAELPPPPPKPLKAKKQTTRRGSEVAASDAVVADEPESTDESETSEAETETDEPEPSEPEPTAVDEAAVVDDASPGDEATTEAGEDTSDEGKLRNRRPGGKSSSRLFRRSRGGNVALED
jgi:hypothetical protein